MTKNQTRALLAVFGVLMVLLGLNRFASSSVRGDESYDAVVAACLSVGGDGVSCECAADLVAREGNLVTWVRLQMSERGVARKAMERCS